MKACAEKSAADDGAAARAPVGRCRSDFHSATAFETFEPESACYSTDLIALTLTLIALAAATSIGLGRVPAAHETSAPQAAPFLGGGTPETHAWQRYHFRAYTMVPVFIVFEMEMMFMYPWAVL